MFTFYSRPVYCNPPPPLQSRTCFHSLPDLHVNRGRHLPWVKLLFAEPIWPYLVPIFLFYVWIVFIILSIFGIITVTKNGNDSNHNFENLLTKEQSTILYFLMYLLRDTPHFANSHSKMKFFHPLYWWSPAIMKQPRAGWEKMIHHILFVKHRILGGTFSDFLNLLKQSAKQLLFQQKFQQKHT